MLYTGTWGDFVVDRKRYNKQKINYICAHTCKDTNTM